MPANEGLIDEIIAAQAKRDVEETNKLIEAGVTQLLAFSKAAREASNSLMSIDSNGKLTKTFNDAAEKQGKLSEQVNKVTIANDKLAKQQEKARIAEIKLQQQREKAFDDYEKKLQKQVDAAERAAQREITANEKAAKSKNVDTSQSSYAGRSDSLPEADAQRILSQNQQDAQRLATDAAKASDPSGNSSKKTSIDSETESFLNNLSASQELLKEQFLLKTQAAEVSAELKKNATDYSKGKLTLDQYAASTIKLKEQLGILEAELVGVNQKVKLNSQATIYDAESLNAAKVAVKQLSAERDTLNILTQEGTVKQQELNKKIDEYNRFIKASSDALAQQKINVGNYPNATNQPAKPIGSAGTVVTTVISQLTTLKNATKEGSQEFISISAAIERFEGLLEASSGKVLKNRLALATMREVLTDLGQELGVDSAAFKKLALEAGGLTDRVSDVNATVKHLGSDTKNIDALVGGIQGLTAGFEIAQGASALLGDKEEDLQKTLVKVQAAMAIANGVQQIANLLQKESSLMLFLNTLKLRAQAAATTLYAFATGGATAATNAFRIALISTGIGAIVVLLGAAIVAMTSFGKSASDTAEEEKKFNDELDKSLENLNKVIDATEKLRNSRKDQGPIGTGEDQLKRELALLKAKGATDIEIFNKEQEIREKEKLNLKIRYETIASFYNDKKKTGKLSLENDEKLQQQLLEINKTGQDKANEIEAASLDFRKKQHDKANKRTAEERQNEADAERKYLENKLKNDEYVIQEDANAQKEIYENSQNSLQDRLDALEQHSIDLKQLNNFEYEKQKADLQVSLNQIIKIESKTYKDRTDSEKKLLANKRAINEELDGLESRHQNKDSEIYRNGRKERINILKSASEQELQEVQLHISDLQTKRSEDLASELQNLSENLSLGLISRRQYLALSKAAQDQFAKDVIRIQIEQLEDELLIGNLTREDYKKTKEAINQLRQEYNEKTQTNNSSGIFGLSNDQFKHFEASVNAATKLIGDLNNLQAALSEKRIAESNKEIKAIDDKSKIEIDAVNKLAISQEEKDRKIAKIEADASARKDKEEEKQKIIQHKAAVRQKSVTIALLAINGALAVINAYKDSGPIGAVIAAVSVAAEIAIAAATPIPSYAKGAGVNGRPLHAGGKALIGEAGAEIIEEPGKQPYIIDKPTIKPLPPGTRVIPNDMLPGYFSMLSPQALGNLKQSKQDNSDIIKAIKDSSQKERETMLKLIPRPVVKSIFGSANQDWVNR